MTIAKVSGSDAVLLQNGVYFAQEDRLGTFSGTPYLLDDYKRLRGIKDSELYARIKLIDYTKLTDIITSGDKVIGMF